MVSIDVTGWRPTLDEGLFRSADELAFEEANPWASAHRTGIISLNERRMDERKICSRLSAVGRRISDSRPGHN
jgi:hypothetical protein